MYFFFQKHLAFNAHVHRFNLCCGKCGNLQCGKSVLKSKSLKWEMLSGLKEHWTSPQSMCFLYTEMTTESRHKNFISIPEGDPQHKETYTTRELQTVAPQRGCNGGSGNRTLRPPTLSVYWRRGASTTRS